MTGRAFRAFLHQGDDQSQHHKGDGHPLGPAGQLGVPALGLVLGQEGVGAAGDGPVETGGLALLQQHHGDQKDGQQNLDHSQDDLDHSFSFLSIPGPKSPFHLQDLYHITHIWEMQEIFP